MRYVQIGRGVGKQVAGNIVCCVDIELEGSELTDHLLNCQRKWFICPNCDEKFSTGRARNVHQVRCQNGRGHSSRGKRKKVEDPPGTTSAVKGLFKIIEFCSNPDSPLVIETLQTESERLADIIGIQIEFYGSARFYLTIVVTMERTINESEEDTFSFTSSPATDLLPSTDISDEIHQHIEILSKKIDEFLRNGSGWVLKGLVRAHLNITKYNPMAFGKYIPLPEPLKKRKGALLNIQNNDNMCLKWVTIAARHPYPKKDPHAARITYYKQFEKEIDDTGIVWPITLKQIPKFESLNRVRINVVGYDEDNDTDPFYPVLVSKSTHADHLTVNTLILGNENTSHFVLIKSINALLKKDNTKALKYHCVRCFHGFSKESNLLKHQENCIKFRAQGIRFPEDDQLFFKSYRKMVKCPVYIVADFESYIKDVEGRNTVPIELSGSTQRLKEHGPCGFAYMVVTEFEDYKQPVVVHRDNGTGNVAEIFISMMHEEYERLTDLIHANEDMKPLSAAQRRAHYAAANCYLCNELFTEDNPRVKDHDHYTGEYIGPAHFTCNFERRTDKHLPIIFHNFRGYDCHLIVQALAEQTDCLYDITIIPNSMEKYVSITTKEFRFIDSLQHLSTSLDKLTRNLVNSGLENFKYTREFIDAEHDGCDEKFELLTRKGVYPYSYIDEAAKFDEDLPPQHCFYNDMADEALSDEDYALVQGIWTTFDLQCLGDLHDLYVTTDVLLLADVLEKYRKMCWDRMGLEALCYVSLPSLTFDACLKLTKTKLEIVKDIDMLQMIELGIRGGISVISHRHAKANNPEIPNFDPSLPESYLLYIDANNLYGYAMSEKIPVDGFKWLDATNWTRDRIMSLDPNGKKGYIFEVDLLIPDNIHDKTDMYPLCPEHLEITESMISPKSR
ncbi:hypothetical protein ACHWQZ_G018174 [Mnemiopsis leidyi]